MELAFCHILHGTKCGDGGSGMAVLSGHGRFQKGVCSNTLFLFAGVRLSQRFGDGGSEAVAPQEKELMDLDEAMIKGASSGVSLLFGISALSSVVWSHFVSSKVVSLDGSWRSGHCAGFGKLVSS